MGFEYKDAFKVIKQETCYYYSFPFLGVYFCKLDFFLVFCLLCTSNQSILEMMRTADFLPFCPKSITAIEFLQYASLYRQPPFSQTKWPPTFVNKLFIVNFFNPLLIFVKLNRNLTDYSHIFNNVLRYYKRNRNCYESFTLSQMNSLLYFSTWFQYV